MVKQVKKSETKSQVEKKNSFHPHRLISDEEFQSNMDVLIVFYQLLKKKSKRFAPIEWDQKELLAS
jgi:hypothetical protein